ncbi:ribose 1,5-bisphosphokinase [Pectobacteriaceae bacterium CE70]|uniref:Ribose 1,5-bisphosphate phosphokinase PhnN n=1 Tax=Serratia sp. (strain ATCC 39006) TaxID=104623 RepID=A0A2I5TMC0_SERS3|nr:MULTISPECIES: ribose 1,5-bisphosphokinase [Enterobacterales]WJV63982.1 ribose 1,5-bisphosphokinase [Pectobacteriaceae bacterium C52]WJV68394.1 ribose 1,5-bisphosphokinase [Pectobacteriaceae bacterium CE70]WJY12326.1 ribose 1,5-bisphosphokinase [Pectobacteriaceae bacterium C80]WJY13719.1 ribose 1,5-bisphosphokinase [Pectobacteriaceae bacterium CE90]AUH01388.1 ribose 1,5-bisphosphokinase [Serratia sp. ATCC 39006]
MARLIWLMGASGSGKDSLLAALRQQALDDLLVAHRYITRPADAGGENHVALSEREFICRQVNGLFALHWQAHQHYYGLGIEIDVWLGQGLDVVANGSRFALHQAQARYGAQLLPVCLQVSTSVLAQRLRQRGRESAAEIEQRLRRANNVVPADCQQLMNDGPLSHTLLAFCQLLEKT